MTMEKRTDTGTRRLTLQQKIVGIRRQIPALVRRAYSEEVSYDFTKIDDIYRYMTPAMNAYQVNLEIVAETSGKKDELGNPVFVQYLAQCQMWMYEADLTLKWINAENPEDTDSMVIHAIGSHEFPDKAKGSAWTYALKYYLLNKFCIDQGGEDPDMRGLKETGTSMAEQDGFYDSTMEMEQGEFGEDEAFEEQEPESAPVTEPSKDAPEKSEKQEKQVQNEKPAPTVPSWIEESQEMAWASAPKQPGVSPEPEGQKPAASPHILPENGSMVHLPDSAVAAIQSENGMTVEEAMQIKCTPGVYGGHTLGSLAQLGQEGINALTWYAKGYSGKRKELQEGARLLLHAAKAA